MRRNTWRIQTGNPTQALENRTLLATGTVSGNVDDGISILGNYDSYTKGSKVFIDLNKNGSLNAGEPFGLTDDNGYFQIDAVPTGVWPIRFKGPTSTWKQIY